MRIAKADQPELFEFLLAWLQGGASGELPPLAPAQRASMMLCGLLVSDAEMADLPPGAAPELGEGKSVAAALCPQVRLFLDGDPAMPEASDAAGSQLTRKGYAELPPLLAPADLAAMRAFYRALADGGWTHHDQGKSGRRVIHNDPLARHLLESATPLIAELAGAPLKPSYAFAAEYGPGDELARHTDRSQCEYTVSLFIDHRPGEQGADCPWPLVIHAPDGDVTVRQPAGGGPVFRGRELPHSRPPRGEGQRSQMLFLHYVPADFAGPLD